MASQEVKNTKKYQQATVRKLLQRQPKQTLLVSVGSFSYFLFLSLGILGRYAIRKTIRIEELPLLDNEELIGSTRQQLVQLLFQIEVGLFLLISGLLLFGLFFFMTGLRRQLLLFTEEIKIKYVLGAEVNQLTYDFYLEQTVPIIFGGGLALVVADVIYGLAYLVITHGYQQPWHSEWYYPLKANSLVILMSGIVWLWQYRGSKRAIDRLTK